MGLSRDLPTGATETAFSHELSLRHVYFFVNNQPLESHSSCPIAGPMVNGSPEVERVDPSVEKGNLEWKSTSVVEPSLDHIYFFVDQKNQNILLQPCRNEDAGDDAANHTKKQLTSNLRQETGDQSLAAPHKVHIRPLDPITQQFLDEVLPLSETPLLKSGAPPDPAIPLPHAKKSDAGLNPQLKARDHGTINACSVEHFADYQPDSDLSSMNTNSETIASAMDIGTPTVVEIPADAKSVAILKTIKADKIKRAGPTSTFTPRGTAGNFQALCADWGIDTKLPLTFQDAISGLFGQSLLQLLITSSSILQQISNLPVLPDTSNLVALSNGSFTWVSSALLEFQIPENTSIQYGGKAVTILSANIKLDCSKDGTITVLLSANRLGDGHTTWSWSESNVGLFARFVFEQDHLPVTLSHIGKNVTAEMSHLRGITALDLIQTLHLPLGALTNLPLVGKMLKSVLTSATFEYNHILDQSSPPSILAGRVVFKQERLRLGSFDLRDPEVSIIYSSSRSLVTVDEGQWTFKISAYQDALQLNTQVNYEAVDYLARFHVQPKTTLTLVDFLKLLAPNQVKAASQTALKDFTVDQADVVLDTSDWSAISCSGDMRFPGGLPSLFEYDAYSSDDIALTSTIDVPTHGYHIDVLAIQSLFDSRPEVLANQKETTFVIEDDEIMVAAPLNNDRLWATLALAVKENSDVGGTTIDFELDELPEIVSLRTDHAASKLEAEDDQVTFHNVHRASIIHMATAVVPGSPLPSPTLVTIASGTDGGPAAGSAWRASRIVPTMSTTLVAFPVSAKKKNQEMAEEKEPSIESFKPAEDARAEEQVSKLQSDIFATTWLDRPAQNEKKARNPSVITDLNPVENTSNRAKGSEDDELPGEQTRARPEKSIASSSFPTPPTSVTSSSPECDQRELDQKSSTSSLGSEFQLASQESTSKPILYDLAKENDRSAGLFIEDVTIRDAQLHDAPKSMSLTGEVEALTDDAELRVVQEQIPGGKPTPAKTLFAEEHLDAESSHGLDFNDAFAPTKQSGHMEEPVPTQQELEERLEEAEVAPVEREPAHTAPSLVLKADLSLIVGSELKEAAPTPTPISITPDTHIQALDIIDHPEPAEQVEEAKTEENENEVETEKEHKSPKPKKGAEIKPEKSAEDTSNSTTVAETLPSSTSVPAEKVTKSVSSGQHTTSQFAEHIPSIPTEAVRPTTTSSRTTTSKSDEAEKATGVVNKDESRPSRSATSSSPNNKRSRRKSILPGKGMRQLLKRAVSFGNLREPLPKASRNISTSTSDTAIPLPPLVMNGSFASGTTEGWQVEAGRNNVNVLKEGIKGYKHKLVVTVRRSSLSGVCLRQRLPTEPGTKCRFKLKLMYDMHGDGFLNVLVDGREVVRHQSTSGEGQSFDVEGSFVAERKGALLELEMKSPFGKMMVFEISGVVVERVGSGRLT